MAEQLDRQLETRLRAVLRAEADAVPFTLRAGELEQRLVARRRAQSRRRMALVAAAIVVGVGLAGVVLSIVRLNALVAASPSPSTSAGLDSLPSFDELLAILPSGAAVLTRGEGTVEDGVSGADLGPTNSTGVAVAVACLGTGHVSVRLATPTDVVSETVTDCLDGQPQWIELQERTSNPSEIRLVLVAPAGTIYRVIATGLALPADCVAIQQPNEPRSFTVENVGDGGIYGDALSSNVALRVEPGSWPVDDLAPLSADSRGLLGFDVASHCVRAWDVTYGFTDDVRAALAAGTEPELRRYAAPTADGHTMQLTGLPIGDLVVRVAVTWDTVPGIDLTDAYLINLVVMPPVPGASDVTGHPDPAVPCGTPDMAAKAPPVSALYQDGVELGTGTAFSGTWNSTGSDGAPRIPAIPIDLARGTGVEVRIAGDVCADTWTVIFGPVPGDGLFTGSGLDLARQDNPSFDPGFAQENHIALAAIPPGEWALSAQLVFDGGSSATLFRVRVGGSSALPVDPAIQAVSVSNPPAAAARTFEVCLVNELVARNGIGVIAGIGRIDHASDAIHYARLTRREPELQTDKPAWLVQFRGDIRLPGGGRAFVDPTCIVVEGGDGGFFATGGVRDPVSGSVSTPLPDVVSPDRALPPPLP